MGNPRARRSVRRWPNQTIPFAIDGAIGTTARTQILQAMATWSAAANLNSVPKTPSH